MNISNISLEFYPGHTVISCSDWCISQISPYIEQYDNTGITLIIMIPVFWVASKFIKEEKYAEMCSNIIPYLALGYLLLRLFL